MTQTLALQSRNMTIVKALTYLMFAMFAMTTDSVGLIIPEVIKTFQLSLTAAGTFQYATMAGIAIAGLFLGQLADRLGRGLFLFCRQAQSAVPFAELVRRGGCHAGLKLMQSTGQRGRHSPQPVHSRAITVCR